MLTRENRVTAAFVAVALLLFLVGSEVLTVGYTLLYAVLILVGVVAPIVVNGYLDRTDAEAAT